MIACPFYVMFEETEQACQKGVRHCSIECKTLFRLGQYKNDARVIMQHFGKPCPVNPKNINEIK